MVNAVKTPEEMNRVVNPVPIVKCKIHKHESSDEVEPAGEMDGVKQSDRVF